MGRMISRTDRFIAILDSGLQTVARAPAAKRPSPAAAVSDTAMSAAEKHRSASLMRVNRAGEISAQALYRGQALFARDRRTSAHLEQAATEEVDHLAWCTERLTDLGGRPSLLDAFWYLGSAAIGTLAGVAGDAASLGFVTETERQVEAHIDDHLRRLPASDGRSRAILEQMAADEARHGQEAAEAGARSIREPVRSLMAAGGGILRQIAYYL
jgi:ubiquinone biosynthesis monooxygenase Coq7